jgi:hypothetical protein
MLLLEEAEPGKVIAGNGTAVEVAALSPVPFSVR